MGRKSVVKSFKMFNAEDITANAVSTVVNVLNLDKASIQISWTGLPVGVLTVEYSNDKDEATAVFHELQIGATIDIDAVESNHQIVFNELPFNLIKLVYTSTSTAGPETMDAVITMKVVGA